MKHIYIFILSIALLQLSFKAIEIGYSARKADENAAAAAKNRLLIQQSNRQTARKLIAIREEAKKAKPKPAPCDLVGFEILEVK